MSITLSIVSGTYNRLQWLQGMVNSARLALPAGISYEFVIVDAGSIDGSLEWLHDQPDIRVIEHGEKRGAIKAFCEGAYAARGEYVLMANDDVTFHPFSITRAIRYLEDTPTCGAVAFADNRPVPGYPDAYKTQIVTAITPAGIETVVTYAQVGLFRKWLGDAVGWWGANDPVMGQARTYGGDNYLSARIWEAGYSVDPVDYVAVTDHIPLDQMRVENTTFTGGIHPDSARYLECYPVGPRIAPEPTLHNPQSRRLRILYLPIYEPGYEHQHVSKRGLRLALKRAGLVYEIDYLNADTDIETAVKAWQPDLLLSQFQDANTVTADRLAYWRALAPGMLVVNWHGDARNHDGPEYLDLLKQTDLQLVVNAAALDVYQKHGIRAAYWQIGYEMPVGELPDMPAHDVVFLGNCYSDDRRALETLLRSNGWRAGFYGQGWAQVDGNTLYDFAAGEALYRGAKAAIGDTFPGQRAFVSNRMFQALAAGAFLLQQTVPDLEAYTGLKDGVHYVAWDDLEDLQAKLHLWLGSKQARKRAKIAKAGQAFVRDNYSFDAQVRKLFVELLPLIAEVAA